MADTDSKAFKLSRRTLLKAGLVTGGALVFTRWIYTSTTAPTGSRSRLTALDGNAEAIIAAVAAVLLKGALPVGNDAREARAEVVAGVDTAVNGLPPGVRKELDQLFSLLSFAPSRSLVAGVWSPWSEASEESVENFLASWRDSRFALLQSGYGALHQLVMAAWYGNPRSWPGIGYAGPPVLVSS